MPLGSGAAPEATAFARGWQGQWGDERPVRLIVEMIDGNHALVVHPFGKPANADTGGGWARYWASVQDGTLEIDSGDIRLVFALSADRASISGEAFRGSASVDRGTMTRCQP